MVNESHNRLQTNGNTHLHSVALKSNQSLDNTLVQIDSEPVIGLNGSINQNTVMGQSVPDNQSNNLFSIRKFPMKSILKNGKVHDSTNEKNILFQTRPRSSILKKPIATIETNQLNGSANSESAISSPQVSENQSASLVSARSPISIVHFRLESAKSTASSSQQQSVSNCILYFYCRHRPRRSHCVIYIKKKKKCIAVKHRAFKIHVCTSPA